MTEITRSFSAKVGVALVAAAMAFSAMAVPAQAQQTPAELQQMINDLLAQIATLQGQLGQGGAVAGPAGVCPYTWTRNLSQGDRGEDVMRLQQFLNANPDTRVAATGAGSAGMETDFFGPATAAAVSKFQTMHRAEVLTPSGLTMPTGFFGPSSRAKANELCVAAPAPAPGDEDEMEDEDEMDDEDEVSTGGPLRGGEATVGNFRWRSGEVADARSGQRDVPVAEITFDVEDGDLSVNRLDLAFSKVGGAAAEDRPWETFRSVALWVDGNKVAEMDVDRRADWTRNTPASGYDRLRFTGLDMVFREGDRAEIVVAVTPRSTIRGVFGSSVADWSVRVPANGMRTRDAVGIDTFEPTELSDSVSFTVEEAGADDEIRIIRSSSDPRATTLELDDSRRSSFINFFSFDVDTRDSDNEIEIIELPMTIEIDGTAATIDDIIDDLQVRIDGRVYRDFTIEDGSLQTSTTTFEFDDELFVDGRVTVAVEARFNALSNSAFEGTTIRGRVTGDNVDAIDAVGANTITELSGSATGEVHTLRTEGLIIEKVNLTQSRIAGSGNDPVDSAEFVLEIDVTAIGDQFFIADSGSAFDFQIQRNDVNVSTSSSATISSNATIEGDRYRVDEGSTERFTLTVTVNPGGDPTAAYRVLFESIDRWDAASSGNDVTQEFFPASDFRSGSVTIIN